MRFSFVKTTDREEVVVYSKNRNELIDSIEKMCNEDSCVMVGYNDGHIKKIDPFKVECFFTLKDKVYALFEEETYQIKFRLYELENLYKDYFIYINQGCLANIYFIDHFDVSIGGSLLVYFKSGHKDYASRRKIKNIKERLGIK